MTVASHTHRSRRNKPAVARKEVGVDVATALAGRTRWPDTIGLDSPVGEAFGLLE